MFVYLSIINDIKIFFFSFSFFKKFIIQSWFTNLIGNADVLKDTKINLKRIIDMVANTDLDMMRHLFKRNIHTLGIIDAGVLRFPDVSRPYFSVSKLLNEFIRRMAFFSVLEINDENSNYKSKFFDFLLSPNFEIITW